MTHTHSPGYHAVTFDFFNTLVHHRRGDGGRGRELMAYLGSVGLESDPWRHQVLYDVLEPHGREYSTGLAAPDRSVYLIRVAERVFRRLNVRAETATAADHASAIWDILGPTSLRVFPEVPPLLGRLRAAGYRLAIVSNWQCGLGHFCVELGLGHAFEHVLASAEVGSQKPSPEIFQEAFRRMGVAPERVLHVGDTPLDDLEGARNAGCRGVLIARGQIDDAAWEEAAIGSLDELEVVLAER